MLRRRVSPSETKANLPMSRAVRAIIGARRMRAKPGFLQYAVVLLLAAVVAVPLAKRWQLGAVLGYLAAGALIGPSGIHLIGNTEQISQISELGVVLMLFVIGMELSPQRLWVMRRTVFGIGSLQLVRRPWRSAASRSHSGSTGRPL